MKTPHESSSELLGRRLALAGDRDGLRLHARRADLHAARVHPGHPLPDPREPDAARRASSSGSRARSPGSSRAGAASRCRPDGGGRGRGADRRRHGISTCSPSRSTSRAGHREYQVRITASVALKTLPDEKVLWENPSLHVPGELRVLDQRRVLRRPGERGDRPRRPKGSRRAWSRASWKGSEPALGERPGSGNPRPESLDFDRRYLPCGPGKARLVAGGGVLVDDALLPGRSISP